MAGASFDVEGRETSGLHAGTSYAADERAPLASRAASWVIIPPQWQQATLGWDFCTLQNAPRFALLIVLLAVLIFASETLTPGKVEALLEWLHEDALRGSISFVALLVAGHLIAFPSIVLSLAGGAVFGVLLGSALVWVGVSVGQLLAFWVGRYLLREWVSGLMLHYFPKWMLIDSAISKEGWKLVALLRLSPLVPWNVQNYGLAVTGLSFASYALPSTLAIIPWCICTVWFGSLARDLASVADGKIPLQGGAMFAFYGVSSLLLVVGIAYMTIISRRAIRRALASSDTGTGRGIAEELDALELLATSPRAPASPQGEGQWPWQLPCSPLPLPAPSLGRERSVAQSSFPAAGAVPATPFHANAAA